MKYVFFGTPEFAATILEKLIDVGYIPEAVVCNPDEPIGRKQILTPPSAKIMAEKFNISVFQPLKLRDNLEFFDWIKKLKPDLAIIAAYGKIVPKEILGIPIYGFINVHGSLLPAYRGASPIQSTILNGDEETGITLIKLDEKMDHGPVLGKSEIRISKSETYDTLSAKLAEAGAELLIKTIPDYIAGKIKLTEQSHAEATYAGIIKKEDGKINWLKSAEEIERMVRAFYPWPTAWTIWNEKTLKILEAITSNGDNKKTGEVFLKNSELAIKCGVGALVVKKLQLEGGKILTAKDFLNGHKNFVGNIFS